MIARNKLFGIGGSFLFAASSYRFGRAGDISKNPNSQHAKEIAEQRIAPRVTVWRTKFAV
jgi:hypothetical protein